MKRLSRHKFLAIESGAAFSLSIDLSSPVRLESRGLRVASLSTHLRQGTRIPTPVVEYLPIPRSDVPAELAR
jgi:hypothetical protein